MKEEEGGRRRKEEEGEGRRRKEKEGGILRGMSAWNVCVECLRRMSAWNAWPIIRLRAQQVGRATV